MTQQIVDITEAPAAPAGHGRGLAGLVRSALHSPLLRQGGGRLVVAVMFLNGTNFVYHAVESRSLGPRAYGALGSMLGLLVICQVPLTALEVAFTRSIAARVDRSKDLSCRALIRRSIIAGTLILGVMTVVSPFAARFLHLPNAIPFIAAGLAVVPTVVGLVPKSLLLGTLRFDEVARGVVVGAVVRLSVAGTAAFLGLGLVFALVAVAVGETAALLMYLRAARGNLSGPVKATLRLKEAVMPSVAFSGFWALASVDTILARHYLSGLESGYYAAAAAAGKAVLFFPAAIALSAFPRFADATASRPEREKVLRHALVVVGGMVLAAASLVAVQPSLFVSLLFGGAYGGSTSLVGLLAFAGAALGLTQIALYYLLANRSGWALLPWVATSCLAMTVAFNHTSAAGIGQRMLVIAGADLLVMLLAIAMGRQPRPVGARLSHDADLDLSVVVPFLNPGSRFRPNLEQLVAVLAEQGASYEIIAVDDGSTDGSGAGIADMLSERVQLVTHASNTGKGGALRSGFAVSRGQYIALLDADGDIDPGHLANFMALAAMYAPDAVIGSKRHPLSEVEYPALRRVWSVGFQVLTRLLFRLNVRDTQTGIKLLHRDLVAAVLPRAVESGFCFDLEVLVVAQRLGYRRFVEAPVKIGVRFTSTVSIRSVRQMMLDMARIFWRLRVRRAYDDDSSFVAASLALGAQGANTLTVSR